MHTLCSPLLTRLQRLVRISLLSLIRRSQEATGGTAPSSAPERLDFSRRPMFRILKLVRDSHARAIFFSSERRHSQLRPQVYTIIREVAPTSCRFPKATRYLSWIALTATGTRLRRTGLSSSFLLRIWRLLRVSRASIFLSRHLHTLWLDSG